MNKHFDNDIKYIRWTVWAYFWFLLIEGALRKWVVPQLGAPLLIVRDPVVLIAYFFALRSRIFPVNRWTISLAIIAGFSFLTSFLTLWNFVPPLASLLVVGYGFRCNYLHLPYIFLIASVLRFEDVKKFGWWTLLLIPPITLLMVAQFQSPPDSFLNRTSSGEGEMMLAAMGKVRTAGPFSFVIGVVAYFALATGFFIWGCLRRQIYPLWLLIAAGSGLAIGISVSGSRSVVAACAVVVASLGAVLLVRPSAVNRFGRALVAVVVVGFVLLQTPIFKEGYKVLKTRFTEVAEASDTSIGGSLLERVGEDFEDAYYVYGKSPLLGYGLGVGTTGGAKLLVGQTTFLLSEVEWSRIFLESGPIVGLIFIIWRCALASSIGWLCLTSVKHSRNVLPLLLFGAVAIPLVTGQLGQPTILGFVVFTTGLALAARKEVLPQDAPPPNPTAKSAAPARPPIPRSSPYARRLHHSTNGHDPPNDSPDR